MAGRSENRKDMDGVSDRTGILVCIDANFRCTHVHEDWNNGLELGKPIHFACGSRQRNPAPG